jgi:anti-sigma factor RsiW
MRNEGRDPEADRLVAAWRKDIQLLRAMAASFDREGG